MALVQSACVAVRGTALPAAATGNHQSSVSRSLVPLRSSVLQAESSINAACNLDHLSRLSFVPQTPARSTAFTARSTLADSPPLPMRHDVYTVGDFMTRLSELQVATPSTSVDEALEILVEKRITGLPVVDDQGRLVGVVSDYDLLALDSISGKRSNEGSLFPVANSTWKAFKEIQTLLGKTHGKTVGELMSLAPLVVRELTNIEDAARILLETKYRRLPVVSEDGKLVGLLTRGNVVRAALIIKRMNEANLDKDC